MNWNPPLLETDRLVLRAVTADDADAIFAACSNPNVTRFTLFDTHRTVADAVHFVRGYALPNYQDMIPDPFGIALKADPAPRLVGCVGCHWASRPHLTLELGYWLAEHLWGRGITAEAAAAVVRFCFAHYPAERIQARVVAGNAASVRVLEKLGFRFEGTLRQSIQRRGEQEDVLMFATTRGDRSSGD